MLKPNLQNPQRASQHAHKFISRWKWRYNESKNLLNLSCCPIDYLPALNLKQWTTVTNLSLGDCEIGDQGFQVGVLREDLAGVRVLDLHFTRIGSRGAKFLSKANLPFLEQLKLNSCQLGNQGTIHLTKASWPSLKKLQLSNPLYILVGNYIGLPCAQALREVHWPNFVEVTLWGNNGDQFMFVIVKAAVQKVFAVTYGRMNTVMLELINQIDRPTK